MWRSIWKLAAIALGCALAATAAQYENPAWSPDGKSIALTSVENRASRIVVMDSGGSNSKPVTPIEQRSRWSAWSPDGKRIAYFVQGPVSEPVNEIWQVNVDTLARAKLSDFGLGTTTLDWSAVRNEIALTRGTGKETGIDILNLETPNTACFVRGSG
jgi:Tol biopolymer transport system component